MKVRIILKLYCYGFLIRGVGFLCIIYSGVDVVIIILVVDFVFYIGIVLFVNKGRVIFFWCY